MSPGIRSAADRPVKTTMNLMISRNSLLSLQLDVVFFLSQYVFTVSRDRISIADKILTNIFLFDYIVYMNVQLHQDILVTSILHNHTLHNKKNGNLIIVLEYFAC